VFGGVDAVENESPRILQGFNRAGEAAQKESQKQLG
jgi:hypothetical protein